MTIYLKYGATTLPLDPDLYWSDEYRYSPVQQSVDTSLSGAQIVQVDGDASRKGRPITLEPEDEFSAWMIRQDIDTLNAWAKVPGAVFQLTIRGEQRDVMMRHQDAPAVDAKPVTHYSDAVDSDYYLVTLKFMTV